MKPLPDGTFRFIRPNGRVLPQAPALPKLPNDSLAPLAERLVAAGVDIDALGSEPMWDGSRLRLAEAIDGLWTPAGAAN